MKPFVADYDSVDLHRRGIMKGALCAAAASVLAPKLLWASPTPEPGHYILLQGTLAPEASSSLLARITLPKLALAKYIEFARHAAIFQELHPEVGQHVGVWLPFTSPIYTSDDPYTPIDPSMLKQVPIPFKHSPNTFTGLLMDDGSPASLIMAPGGYPEGLTGARKAGPELTIKVTVSKTPFSPGRNATNQLSAVLASASITSAAANSNDAGHGLLFNLLYEPASTRVTLGFTYKNVQSIIMATCSMGKLLRTATYYGETSSNQTLMSNAGNMAFGIALAPNPVAPAAIDRILAFTPALATVSQHIPYGMPMQMLGNLDILPNESQPAFVQRATDAVTDALPAMAACLCASLDPSIATLARWLGWNIVADNTALQGSFADAYTFAQAFAKAHGASVVSPSFHRIPTIMDPGYDSAAPDPEDRDKP